MTSEEFLRDVCPNHTDKSKWNKSELLYILELHTEQLRKHAVVGQSEPLKCGNNNPPCSPNIKFGYLECTECNWSE